jgi:hypothetical protein
LLKFGKIHGVVLISQDPKKRERKTLELRVHFYGEFCGTFAVVIIVNMA